MKGLGKAALWVGLASLLVGIGSRLTMTPIIGLTAHSFLGFAQACFLLSIATSLCCCEK